LVLTHLGEYDDPRHHESNQIEFGLEKQKKDHEMHQKNNSKIQKTMKKSLQNHNYNDDKISFNGIANEPIATRDDFWKRIHYFGRVTYDGRVLGVDKWHSDRDQERLLKKFDDFFECMSWFRQLPAVIRRQQVSTVKKDIEQASGTKNIPAGIVLLAALAKGYSIWISKKNGGLEIRRRCGGVQTPKGE